MLSIIRWRNWRQQWRDTSRGQSPPLLLCCSRHLLPPPPPVSSRKGNSPRENIPKIPETGRKKKKKKKKRKGNGKGGTDREESKSEAPQSSRAGKAREIPPPKNPASQASTSTVGGNIRREPPPKQVQAETWATVVGRKAKAKNGAPQKTGDNRPGSGPTPPVPGARPAKVGAGKRTPAVPAKAKKRAPPKSAAIILTCPEGKYGEAMDRVRGAIRLPELGIAEVRTKRAFREL